MSSVCVDQFTMTLIENNMFNLSIVLLVTIMCYSVHGILKLPSYLKACSKSDQNFNECTVKHGREAISSIVKGDPKYHIPCLDPLKLDRVSLQGGGSLKLFATDLQLLGLKDTELQHMDWNVENKTIKMILYVPTLTIIAQYNLDGRILIMNLKGSGPMNNTESDCQIFVDVTYDTYDKNMKQYLKLTNLTVNFSSKKSHFQFGNLLNNKQISDQMNVFLNENWEVVGKDLIPGINNVIVTIIISIASPLAEKIPLETIILP